MEELAHELGPLWEAGGAHPPPRDVFKAFRLTPFKEVTAVILGEDPYPNARHATGLAFSVPRTVRPHPASLRNIFHELQSDLCIAPAMSGDLTRWAVEEGVLPMNCSLTTGARKDREWHAELWRGFTDAAIKLLSDTRSNLVFLLWGSKAKAKVRPRKGLIARSRHCVLEG